MWDLSGPGIKPVSPELAAGFLTAAATGMSPGQVLLFFQVINHGFSFFRPIIYVSLTEFG